MAVENKATAVIGKAENETALKIDGINLNLA